nr:MAG TPA: hypothetical protein [Bacteriophage sp.]
MHKTLLLFDQFKTLYPNRLKRGGFNKEFYIVL